MSTSIRARRGARGFSFVELLITIVIAAIAFLAMVPLFISTTKANSVDKVRLQAVNVAQDKLEKIRQLDYDLITATNLLSTVASASPTWKYAKEFGPTWKSDRGRVYGVSYVVDEVSDASSHKLYKRVSVTVDWTAPPGRAPNSFEQAPFTIDPVSGKKVFWGVTLRTFVYKQYASPQIVDLDIDPDTSSGLLTLDTDDDLTLKIQAILNPQDDNAMVEYVQFKGYGASTVPVLDAKETDKGHGGDPLFYGVTLDGETLDGVTMPKLLTDGSQDGLYRIEATAYSANSSGGLPGNSYSEEFRLETGLPPAPPVPTATAGNNVAFLQWASAAADVVSYEVFRSIGSGDFTSLGVVPTPTFWDTGLTNGTTYKYRVVAYDSAHPGVPGLPSTDVTAVPLVPADATSPPAPVVTSVPTVEKAVLTWLDVVDVDVNKEPTTGIDHYLVYRDSDSYPYSVASPDIPNATVAWWQDITEGTNHTYTVSSVDVAQNASPKSAPVTVPYIAPALYTLTLTSNRPATYTVKNRANVVVAPADDSSTSYTYTLPEGSYSVSASIEGTTRGPTPVVLDRNGVSYNFVFLALLPDVPLP